MKNKVVLALSLVMLMPGVCQAANNGKLAAAKDAVKGLLNSGKDAANAELGLGTSAVKLAAIVVTINVANALSEAPAAYVKTINWSALVSPSAWAARVKSWIPFLKKAEQTVEGAIVSGGNAVADALTGPNTPSVEDATRKKLGAKPAVQASATK